MASAAHAATTHTAAAVQQPPAVTVQQILQPVGTTQHVCAWQAMYRQQALTLPVGTSPVTHVLQGRLQLQGQTAASHAQHRSTAAVLEAMLAAAAQQTAAAPAAAALHAPAVWAVFQPEAVPPTLRAWNAQVGAALDLHTALYQMLPDRCCLPWATVKHMENCCSLSSVISLCTGVFYCILRAQLHLRLMYPATPLNYAAPADNNVFLFFLLHVVQLPLQRAPLPLIRSRQQTLTVANAQQAT